MSQNSISLLCIPTRLTGAVVANRFVTSVGAQTAADGNALGIARNAGTIGELAPVDVEGTATVETGAAIALGATVKADASGRAITWITSGARVGIALEAATAAGQFIEIRLIQNAA